MQPPRAFQVHLARCGRTLHVPADRTLLQVLQEGGVCVPTGCLEGLCGACETRVVLGQPEHRDRVYANRRHPPADRLVVCVSRALGDALSIDL